MGKEYGEKLWKFSEVQGKYNQALPVFRFSLLVLPVWNNHMPDASYNLLSGGLESSMAQRRLGWSKFVPGHPGKLSFSLEL